MNGVVDTGLTARCGKVCAVRWSWTARHSPMNFHGHYRI